MSKEELNLFQIAAGLPAELGAGAAQIVRCQLAKVGVPIASVGFIDRIFVFVVDCFKSERLGPRADVCVARGLIPKFSARK
jgi:hypothetical protein